MTLDDIIRMAVKCHLVTTANREGVFMDSLAEFAQLVAAQQRELIVTECINIVKPTQHHEAFAQGYLGDIDGLELLDGKVKQIKQHFGVEE